MGVKVGDICDTRVLSKCRMGQESFSFLRIEGRVGEKKRLFAPSVQRCSAPSPRECARIQLAYMGENDENCSLKAGYAR